MLIRIRPRAGSTENDIIIGINLWVHAAGVFPRGTIGMFDFYLSGQMYWLSRRATAYTHAGMVTVAFLFIPYTYGWDKGLIQSIETPDRCTCSWQYNATIITPAERYVSWAYAEDATENELSRNPPKKSTMVADCSAKKRLHLYHSGCREPLLTFRSLFAWWRVD